MGFIYKITNLINQKVYIGQTSRTIDIRWQQHLYSSKDGESLLYRAMRKYGIENFSIEQVEETSLLNEREIFWINYYNSFEKGYNMTLGGEGSQIIQRDKIISLWNQGLNLSDISLKTGHAKRHISNALQAEGITKEEIFNRGRETACAKRSIPVYKFDLNGNFINSYCSAKEAGRDNNLSASHILNCCNDKELSCGGFLWSFSQQIDKQSIFKISEKKQGGKIDKRPVEQRDKNNNYIQTFESLGAAAKAVNGSSANIFAACNGRQKTAYGFKWNYSLVEVKK